MSRKPGVGKSLNRRFMFRVAVSTGAVLRQFRAGRRENADLDKRLLIPLLHIGMQMVAPIEGDEVFPEIEVFQSR